jgi:MFS family permease
MAIDSSAWTGARGPGMSAPPATVRRARCSVVVAMFLLGLYFASWAPRIPAIRAELGLGDGALGVALLGAPVGGVITTMLAGWPLRRLGSARLMRLTLIGYCLAGPLTPLARSQAELFVALGLWMGISSALDVAVNAYGVEVERLHGRPIMSSLHAAWTAGAMSGSALGAGAAALGISPERQVTAVGLGCLMVALPTGLRSPALGANGPGRPDGAVGAGRAAGPDHPDDMVGAGGATGTEATGTERSVGVAGSEGAGRRAKVERDRSGEGRPTDSTGRRWTSGLVTLCALALASFFAEGAAGDWSSVYLRDVTGAPAGLAGAGYVAFTATMLLTRLVGDRVVERFGATAVVRTAAAGAGLLVAAGLAERGTAGGLVAFAAIGVGAALVIPTTVSAAARLPGMPVRVVVSCGYAGWLLGPPLLGALAELVGLRTALVTVVGLLTVIVVLAPVLGRRADEDRGRGRSNRPERAWATKVT